MKRTFSIVEIMLDGFSGQVDGVVTVNEWTGAIEQVDCRSYDFFDDASDHPIILNETQRRAADRIVVGAIELDGELTASEDKLLSSAANLSAATTELSPAQRILAEYLQQVRPTQADSDLKSDEESRLHRFG